MILVMIEEYESRDLNLGSFNRLERHFDVGGQN